MGMVNCSGDESELISCDHVDSPQCDRFSDAGVICQGKTLRNMQLAQHDNNSDCCCHRA